jgi:hypothetical protein
MFGTDFAEFRDLSEANPASALMFPGPKMNEAAGAGVAELSARLFDAS